MTLRTALAAVLLVCIATCASAQTAPEEDGRTQYPAFMTNSYFTFTVGSIGYLFGERQLEPGFEAEAIDKPRLAVRADFFGHHFTKHLSAQITYMRPARFIAYRNVNGTGGTKQVSNAYAGLTFVLDAPLHERASIYVEGGGGVTSRSGFEIDGRQALQAAHYTAGILGGGFAIHATRNMDLMIGATYSPGRRSFNQPSTRMYTTGLRYHMRPLPQATVDENRQSGYAFPANVVRVGYASNAFSYGVNNFFSRRVPIFWGGNVETRRGVTLDYQRNVFHTKKVFAFDLGASTGHWQSNGLGDNFTTLSGYPMFRFFIVRSEPADFYFNYSLAGPTMISDTVLDGRSTGARFTFQDFMGAGAFIGRSRRMNVELGIRHYSNGNLFTTNASIKVPLTLTLGLTF
jgi:hypothetical protein